MFTKLVRIGRDAEMKTTTTGTQLLEMTVVYDIGFGEKKKPQCVKLSMFGQKAPKLVQHFTKGKQIVATMDEVGSQAWIDKVSGQAKSGMSATLVSFDFVSGGEQQAAQQQQYNQAPQHQRAPQQQAPSYGTPPPNHAPQQQPPTNQMQ